MRRRFANSVTTRALAAAAAFALVASSAFAGGLIRAPAVGGVYIDAEGVVAAPPAEGSEQLRAAWQAGLEPAPADLQSLVDLRFISLRGLNAKLAEVRKAGLPVPDEVRYLAGLLRVKHVLVYPPTDGRPGDIVLAGPAEGWKVDRLGNTVGVTTGRPVLMLDDLVVALRAAESANGPGLSCSIDPTPEGLARAQQVTQRLNPAEGPFTAARRLEQAYGRQVVSIAGVPASSHFARSLVAADFRMKQIAMDFEPAPVGGLPSYLEMVDTRSVKGNLMPRWWLASNYEPLARDKDGLAWEIRGQGVKCLSEEDFVDEQGAITRGAGRKNTDANRWAEAFTERFEELADHDSAFGQVRNAFDLAVAASLMSLEDLWTAAQLSTPQLAQEFAPEEYATPKFVATQASFLKRGNKWVITASGGVQVFPWQVADKSEESPRLAELRESHEGAEGNAWWWQ